MVNNIKNIFIYCLLPLLLPALLTSCGSGAGPSAADSAAVLDSAAKDSARIAVAPDTQAINEANKLMVDSLVKAEPAMAAEAQLELPDKYIAVSDSSEMIKIPAGEFIYGMNPPERNKILRDIKSSDSPVFESEHNKKKMYLPAYFIDKYEVTNAAFLRFVNATGHKPAKNWSREVAINNPDLPVVNVGWPDARAYAKWAHKRLPTEEEWEKAARGTDGRIWPWGNEPDGEVYNGSAQGNYGPKPIGSFPKGASPYGIYDMAGNVYEMTTGKWHDSNAMRGGSFLNGGSMARATFRWAATDTVNGAKWLGFRCVKDTAQVQKYLQGLMKK